MGEDNRRDRVVRYWWTKAEESLAAAERELDAVATLKPLIFSLK